MLILDADLTCLKYHPHPTPKLKVEENSLKFQPSKLGFLATGKSTLTVEWRVQNPEGKRGHGIEGSCIFSSSFHFLSLLGSFSNIPPCRLFFAIAWGTSSGKGSSKALSVAGSRKILLTMYMSWPLHRSTGKVPLILRIQRFLVSQKQKVQFPIAIAYWSLPVLLVNWVCSSTVARPPSPNHPQKVVQEWHLNIHEDVASLHSHPPSPLPTQQLRHASEMERRDPDSSKPHMEPRLQLLREKRWAFLTLPCYQKYSQLI